MKTHRANVKAGAKTIKDLIFQQQVSNHGPAIRSKRAKTVWLTHMNS